MPKVALVSAFVTDSGLSSEAFIDGIAAARYLGRDQVQGLVLLRTESTLSIARKVWSRRVPAPLRSVVTL